MNTVQVQQVKKGKNKHLIRYKSLGLEGAQTGCWLGSFNTVNGRVEAARLDDFQPIHIEVSSNAVFLLEAVELSSLLSDQQSLIAHFSVLETGH